MKDPREQIKLGALEKRWLHSPVSLVLVDNMNACWYG
ncbi:hypothetical protein lpari_01947 [Legionella parisiensis]|uniref:Uncharacterized protein n=1 Tax=Legionella parisiensis TaxID=45071 RepID=A0A1E5JR88_9GAMM|nr:hypothetical protein lpari_01947 [Legionella parisiensis]STX71788.1 Uncharacterised protein [Legionella parisiensis]